VAKQVVRGLRLPDTRQLANRVLRAATADEVQKVLAESMATAKSR
jgi:phosphoenolpyruvate-protein kinase (PTS system EI component)